MTRSVYALLGVLILAVGFGFGLLSVMRLEGLALIALSLLMQGATLVLVGVKRRSVPWLCLLITAIMNLSSGVVGVFSGQPFMRLSLLVSIEQFEHMADRCLAAQRPYCVLDKNERRYASSVSLVRFGHHRATAINPHGWYVFLVRPEDDAARQFLLQHRCMKVLTSRWFIEHRC